MLFGPSENCEAAAESLKNQLMEFDKELQKRGDFFGGKAMIKKRIQPCKIIFIKVCII